MRFLYSLSIYFFQFLLFLHGLFNAKTGKWNRDRVSHFRNLPNIKAKAEGRKIVWMHCASLGEYEQGIPLIKAMKDINQHLFVLISFFSPSGFEHKKSNHLVDEYIYMPLDTIANSKKGVEILKPALFIGVKYEYWWNLIHILKTNSIPIVYISVVVKPGIYFLKKWSPFNTWLHEIDFLFTQDDQSLSLLKLAGCKNVYTTGDTRLLSVLQRLENTRPIDLVKEAIPDNKIVIIYGSIYLSDIGTIGPILAEDSYFHIVVPHDISHDNIAAIKNYTRNFILFTKLEKHMENINGIVVDTIGHLFDLYQYGDIIYIGGGFERNIHNTLEPAVFGHAIAFGPKHNSFIEAQFFLDKGIATEVRNAQDFREFVHEFRDGRRQKEVALLADSYFKENSDSVQSIVNILKERNILLNFS